MYMKTREKKERDLKRREVYILFEDRDLSPSLKLCLAFDEIIYNSLFPLSLKIFLRPFFKIFNGKNDCFWIFNWFFSHPAHNSDANVGEYPIIKKGKEEDRWIRWKIQKGIKSGSFLESSTLSRPILLHATSAYSASTYKRVERAT